MMTSFPIVLIVIAVSLIFDVIGSKKSRKNGREERTARRSVKDRSSFSYKAEDFNSHQQQTNYSMAYSTKEMSPQERFQYQREQRELARIKDKPLSEAERRTIYGN